MPTGAVVLMLSLDKHTRSLLLATVAAEREALARVAPGPPGSQLLMLGEFDASVSTKYSLFLSRRIYC